MLILLGFRRNYKFTKLLSYNKFTNDDCSYIARKVCGAKNLNIEFCKVQMLKNICEEKYLWKKIHSYLFVQVICNTLAYVLLYQTITL